MLGDDEALDLHLQPLPRPAHENTLFLERLDDLQDAADIVDRRVAHVRERRRRDHRADAVAREELEQQRAVDVPADEMRAHDAVVAGPDRVRQVVQDIRRLLAAASREQRLGILGRQLGQQLPAAAHPFGLHQENELVRGHRTATWVATSSSARLKISPVGE